ncbi:hypothetical protein M758_UG003600 [Ceratodon purpureus]|nr:hypothetical protein M758_UG003600 [Ceratodon purpureus]
MQRPTPPYIGAGSNLYATQGGQPGTNGVCASYETEIKAAMEHLQNLMDRSRGVDTPTPLPESFALPPQPQVRYATTSAYPPALENTGNASTGLPTPSALSLDSPLTRPPESSLFAAAVDPTNTLTYSTEVCADNTLGLVPNAMGLTQNLESVKRALQRKAEADFLSHRRANTGTKFKIVTDAAGNILTNKLRVTSLINQLMAKFVDVAQIHYEDNDDRFLLVEELVRDEFEFEPPLKRGWFTTYMRKKLEKSRSLFRKHWEEKGERHPECKPEKHAALVSWWNSPIGSNSSNRMKGLNDEKKKKRLSLHLGGVPQIQMTGNTGNSMQQQGALGGRYITGTVDANTPNDGSDHGLPDLGTNEPMQEVTKN